MIIENDPLYDFIKSSTDKNIDNSIIHQYKVVCGYDNYCEKIKFINNLRIYE